MNTVLNNLTPEERKALALEALAEERAKAAKLEEDRMAYKELVSEKVESLFPGLREVSAAMTETKKLIYEEFETAKAMKADLYDVREDQNRHSFMNKACNERITIGDCIKDDYDDTVNEGIAKVKGFISSLARDEESRMLVSSILRLLARDQKGNLKASRVMQLRKMAEESGNEVFMDGVRIIEQAYRPMRTKAFVRAEYKDETGNWITLPLGMTEA